MKKVGTIHGCKKCIDSQIKIKDNIMKLLENIRQKLNEKELNDFVKALGYYNIPKGKASLKKLTDCKDLSEWFKTGHYDLVFNAEQFLEAVTNALGINIINYRFEIAQSQSYYLEDQNFRKCRFRVECRSKGNSFLSYLHYINSTNIPLDPKIIKYRKISDILDSLSNIVRHHYDLNNDESFFGGILNYYYIHYDNTKYIFDIKGRIISISSHNENKKDKLRRLLGITE